MSDPGKVERLARKMAMEAAGFVAVDHEDVAYALEYLRPYAELLVEAREMLAPFAHFAAQFEARPIRGLDDTLYSIHGGGDLPGAANFKLSDCKAARALLSKLEAL